MTAGACAHVAKESISQQRHVSHAAHVIQDLSLEIPGELNTQLSHLAYPQCSGLQGETFQTLNPAQQHIPAEEMPER